MTHLIEAFKIRSPMPIMMRHKYSFFSDLAKSYFLKGLFIKEVITSVIWDKFSENLKLPPLLEHVESKIPWSVDSSCSWNARTQILEVDEFLKKERTLQRSLFDNSNVLKVITTIDLESLITLWINENFTCLRHQV